MCYINYHLHILLTNVVFSVVFTGALCLLLEIVGVVLPRELTCVAYALCYSVQIIIYFLNGL